MDVRVISIGTLASHPLWEERDRPRTGHATTTLIRAGGKAILVDPGLPAQALVARLSERSGLDPSAITHIFLTSFRPDVRRGIEAFPNATWWISEREREIVGTPLADALKRAVSAGDQTLVETLRSEVAILRRCQPAPDRLASEHGQQVDLFPLPGFTPGLTGLLIAGSLATTVICGDAVATIEHMEQGKILPGAANVEQAMESFREAIEIADYLILGRDNLTPNLGRRMV